MSRPRRTGRPASGTDSRGPASPWRRAPPSADASVWHEKPALQDSPHWSLLKRATPRQIALASGDRRRGGVEVTVAEAWRALEWLVDGMPKRAERLET